MAERGIFFTPTLLVYEYHRRSPQPHVRERAEALQEHHVAAIRRALELGVRVVAGTDAGGHGHPANAGELDCLVKAGMTPMQALQAATGWAAECLGWEDRLGTVDAGKLADLVVVDGDPLGRYPRAARPRPDRAGHQGRQDRRESDGGIARSSALREGRLSTASRREGEGLATAPSHGSLRTITLSRTRGEGSLTLSARPASARNRAAFRWPAARPRWPGRAG